ncbi:MAG: arginine--tRNA ligase [Myxococcota bacterium]
MIKEFYQRFIISAVRRIFPDLNFSEINMEILKPRRPEWGDISSNAPLVLSKRVGKRPDEVGKILRDTLDLINLEYQGDFAEKIEFVMPGFINIFFSKGFILRILDEILKNRERFGYRPKGNPGDNGGYLIEYVSANPTGPLHIGHGRGAVLGDVLCRILRSQGYDVLREFYVNDAGAQVKNLVLSVIERMKEIEGKGNAEIPEDGYKGDYVKEIARKIIEERNIHYEEALKNSNIVRDFAIDYMLSEIKATLRKLGVEFDSFYFERSLYDKGLVDACIDKFTKESKTYERDGALFLRMDVDEDEKDRVLKKSDGYYTYFASDIAYHKEKFERDNCRYKKLIDIWGSDHHGYIPRMKSAIKLLGYNPDDFIVILVQMVKVIKDGRPVKMSKREGDFVTLDEIIESVGKDATRYTFLMRKSDAQLDFDIDILKSQSLNNPVYYAQYGYARICSILRKAREAGIDLPESFGEEDYRGIVLKEELDIIKKMGEFPDLLESITKSLEPHLLVYYIQELQAMFHQYYTKYKRTEKVLSEDPVKLKGRIALIIALKTVLKNAFELMGIDAPERMNLKGENDEE